MVAADPANATTYRANAAAYLTKLEALDHEVRETVAWIPPDRRKVISTHDAFGYFAVAYDVTFVAPEGVSTETEPSARDIATIIAQIKKEDSGGLNAPNCVRDRCGDRRNGVFG